MAQQLGTAEEAKAMLRRAVLALKSNEAIALSEFNDPDNKQFRDRDLYIFCYKKCLAASLRDYSSGVLTGSFFV